MPIAVNDHPSLRLFAQLLGAPSPSGREERVAAVVREKLDEFGWSHETDPAGNIIVRVPADDADAPCLILASHMDEIAMVVTRIDCDGSLRVNRSGGLHPYKLGESPVEVLGDSRSIVGVFSMGSTHTAGAEGQSMTWDKVRIITGLSPAQLAAEGVRVGSSAVPTTAVRGPIVFGDEAAPLVAAWTFDDRMGVVALLRLLEAIKRDDIRPTRPLVVAFTVHEEGGCHGAKVLAHRERPEIFIAVDGCPIPPGTDLEMDGRPAVWSKDAKCHLDQRLIAELHRTGEAVGVRLQTAVLPNAFSDATAVYDAGAAPRVATVGHVRENSHGFEVARLEAFDNVLKLLVEFVKNQ